MSAPRTIAMAAGAAMVAAAMLGTPAPAGGPGTKCPFATQDCLDKMTKQLKNTGWIGIELDDSSSDRFRVTKVVPKSPAEEAGLQPGDVLTAANGKPISPTNPEALQKAKADWTPGGTLQLTVLRDGAERRVAVKLAPMPADVLARYIGEHMLEHAMVASSSSKAK